MRGSYFEIDERDGFGRLEDTDLVFLDGIYVDAAFRTPSTRSLRLIPPSPFGPPERTYYTMVTGEPGLVVHPFGEGRALYVPWLSGTLVYRHGHPNTSAFVADVLEHHAGLEPLAGTVSPMVEMTLLERDDGALRLLHLVNGSGHFGNRYEAPVPMRDLEITIPFDGEPSAITCLVSGRRCEWSSRADRLTVQVPELGTFEAVKISR
jgi:hypothetical protein